MIDQTSPASAGMAMTSNTPKASPLLPKPGERILVTLATYNEIENLPDLVADIFHYLPQADILVVDDNSADGTGRWCDEAAQQDPRITCLHRAGKLGLGTAILAGLRHAQTKGYDLAIVMDADFSHHPRYLPNLVDGMAPADGSIVDVMIGSRYVAGGGITGWPWKRHLMSKAVNWAARWLLRIPAKDCSGSYRCYRVSKLAHLDNAVIRSKGFSFQEEVLWHLRRAGCKFKETPIVFADRERGQSKISRQEALMAIRVLLGLAVRGLFGLR